MYGNIGSDDPAAIDQCLAKLRKNAIVVNLGCGPNICGHLDNLARAMGRLQRESTLILVDLVVTPIEKHEWISGPRSVRVVAANAATATEVLRDLKVDLVLAFGLFGALSASTTPHAVGKAAWPYVLRECFTLLKQGGKLIISNSTARQPFGEFRDAVEKAGFSVRHCQESAPYGAQSNAPDRRYLLMCAKPRRRALNGPARRT